MSKQTKDSSFSEALFYFNTVESIKGLKGLSSLLKLRLGLNSLAIDESFCDSSSKS
jgi:hypothetical protein